MIRFLLNQQLREETTLSPNLTVLNYLREHVNKTGTKEGCGSGDCGACTVVLGEVVNGRLQYRSVNSCLTFVSALHGKQLITIEDLKNGNDLHPVQQAMVDFHGSQCGFCTPGFIMSMFALAKTKADASRDEIMEALAGNLCRCTGYRPIIDAAESLKQNQTLKDQFTEHEQQTIDRLQNITAPKLNYEFDNKFAFSPSNSDELAQILLDNPDAHILAGGTDLALQVTQFNRELEKIVYVGNVADIKTIKETDTHIEIGANVTLTDAYTVLSSYFPSFGHLLHRFASLQVRNQGTLGGNIANASPIGDAPPLLIALNASILLRRGDSIREMPLEDYFVNYKVTKQQPSEFIQTIRIPKPETNQTFEAYKVSKRIDDDISAVCAAFNFTLKNDEIKDVRVAFGGMAAIPERAKNCEKVLLNQPFSQQTIQNAMQALADDFQPISDFRASKEYRSEIAANLLYRFYTEVKFAESNIDTKVEIYVP